MFYVCTVDTPYALIIRKYLVVSYRFRKYIMSFQFSQNLMGDLQFQSPNSSQSLPSTQQIIPPSQNVSQPLTSQSQFSLPQSENLLENQSLDFPPILNPTSNRADPSSQDLKAVRASLSNRNGRCLA